MIPLGVDLLRQLKAVLGTRLHAEFTPLAGVDVDLNVSSY